METQTETPAESTPPDVELNTISSNAEPIDSEEAALVNKRHRRVSLSTAVRLRTLVLIVSGISAVVLLILGAITFVGAVLDESSAAFAFAFNAILDCMSSVVVIWRFSGEGGNLYSTKKECIACLVLGAFFVVSSIIVTGQSIYSLLHHFKPSESAWLYWGSLIDVAACITLVLCKIYLAYKLESKALLTDAFNTIIGLILASSTLIGYSIYQSNHRIWQIDSITGLICGIVFLLYAIWIVVVTVRVMRDGKQG